MGACKQLEWEVRVNFADYSAGNEHFIQPDIVQYGKDIMATPGFDLILGSNALEELGIILDFWMKEIKLDEISLPTKESRNEQQSFN